MVFNGQGASEALHVKVTGDATDLNSALAAARSGMFEVRAATAALGGALAALGAGGLAVATSAAADFEQAMVEVEKVTDPQTAREMSAAIREMAAELPVAQSELAATAADAARFGIRGRENITAFTESVSKMAVATDLSMAEAGESFARLATLTNTPISQIENFGSAINTLSNNFATSAQEIVDSMLRSSAALRQFGLNQREIAAVSAALNEVSESSERAGTRLRRVGQELLDPRKTEEVADALGMSVDEFERMRDASPEALLLDLVEAFAAGGDAADDLRESMSTASQQAIAGLALNIEGLRDALATSDAAFEDNVSLTREFEAAADTFNARLQITRNRLRNVAIETGEATLPALSDLLAVVNDGIGAFAELNRRSDGLVGSLALVGATAGGVGLALSGLGIAAGGPVTLAIAGIGALALAYSENWADIRSTVDRSAAAITESLGEIDDALETNEQNLGTNASKWRKWARIIEEDVAEKIDFLATGLTQVVTGLAGTLQAQQQVRRGEFEAAIKTLNTTAEEVIEQGRSREARQRTREIVDKAERRIGGRFSAQPFAGLGGPTAGDGDGEPEAPEEAKNYYQEALDEATKQTKNLDQVKAGLSSINGQMADSLLGRSRTVCDLTDHLLGPFERAPFTGRAGGATRGMPRGAARAVASLEGMGVDTTETPNTTRDRTGSVESKLDRLAGALEGDAVIKVGEEELARTAKRSMARHTADEFVVE